LFRTQGGRVGRWRDLLERFPYVHDGRDRLGMVYEARGENREAADCYRKVIAFMREHLDNYDPAFEDKFVKLDPPSPPDQRLPKVHDTQRSCSHNHHLLRAQNTRSNLSASPAITDFLMFVCLLLFFSSWLEIARSHRIKT
jgi:hypothetical protein